MDHSISNWKASDVPSQAGRCFVVTGTGGLGLEVAVVLAKAGAEVIVAGRNAEKGAAALARIQSGLARFEKLDLASLASVASFCEGLRGQRDRLDGLINNAAVMAPPQRQETSDGFELQFGTNYLGPFALTAQLMPLLRSGANARVVTVCSIADRSERLDFDNLQSERWYRGMEAYGQTKFADLVFAMELDRRSRAQGWGVASIASHPGLSRTDIIANGAGRFSSLGLFQMVLGRIVFQSVAAGALSTLYAATSPLAESGGYYGPTGFGGMRGALGDAPVAAGAKDAGLGARLWEVSERLTGVRFGE